LLVAGVLATLCVIVVSIAMPATLAPTPVSSPGPDGMSKYYVVGPPTNGQREYLYQIAVRTLGDGNRYREIFELNKDRRQPDGGQLTDLVELRPGWILKLPADARGPDVKIGPIPSLTDTRPAAAAVPPPGKPTSSTGGAAPYLVAAAALVVMVVLLAAVPRLLRGGRWSRGRPRPASLAVASASSREETVALVTPAGLVLESVEPGVVALETMAPTVLPPPLATSDSAPTGGLASVDAHRPPPAEVDQRPVDTADPDPTAAPPPVVPAGPAPAVGAEPPGLERGRVRVDLQPLAGNEPDRLDVRLLGSGLDEPSPTYAWLGDGSPPEAALPVILGRLDQWRLFVDLAGTPDVFTISGPLAAARRQASLIAEQLVAAGRSVTIVGDVIGADGPAGARRVSSFPPPGTELESRTVPGVIISGGLRGEELVAARGLVLRSNRNVVPVLVGDVLRARWSVLVRVPQAEGAAADGAAIPA
jgi:hypothetical protein